MGQPLILQVLPTGIPVVRPAITETTSLGAAFLAGLAVGFWKDTAEIEGQWKKEKEFQPRMGRRQVDNLCGRWRQALERSKSWGAHAEGAASGTNAEGGTQ